MKVTGPCPENVMSRAVYKQLHKHRTDVKRCLSERYPAVAAMPSESNSNGRLILKSETLTGRAAHIGQMLADRVAAQILAAGAVPMYMTLTVLMPVDVEEQELRVLIHEIEAACERYQTDLLDVQVNVTEAVNQMTVTMTGAGFGVVVPETKAQEGDALVMIGYAGYAGAACIADVKAAQLHERYHPDFIDKAADYLKTVSLAEQIALLQKMPEDSIHQITVCGEQGVFGALWQLARIADVGFEVDLKKILLKQQIVEICDYFDINPYMLESQGAMLVCTNRGEALTELLEAAGYEAAVIGYIKSGHDKCIVNDDEVRYLDMPKGSEIVKAQL